MKKYLGLVSVMAIVGGFGTAANADTQVTYNPPVMQAPMQPEEGNNQIQRAVDQALSEYYTTRDDQTEEETTDEEKEVIYHYDKKDTLFNGTSIPPRLFNNIDYPY